MSAQEARDRLAALLPRCHVSAAETRGITGEHPVQFIRALFGIDQAAALADRLAEGDEALAKVTRVEALHSWGSALDICLEDGQHWPCDTRRALDREPS